MLSSPVDTKGIIRSWELDQLEDIGIYERAKIPAYFTDSHFINFIQSNEELMLWVLASEGLIIKTINNYKVFLVDVRSLRKRKGKQDMIDLVQKGFRAQPNRRQ